MAQNFFDIYDLSHSAQWSFYFFLKEKICLLYQKSLILKEKEEIFLLEKASSSRRKTSSIKRKAVSSKSYYSSSLRLSNMSVSHVSLRVCSSERVSLSYKVGATQYLVLFFRLSLAVPSCTAPSSSRMHPSIQKCFLNAEEAIVLFRILDIR